MDPAARRDGTSGSSTFLVPEGVPTHGWNLDRSDHSTWLQYEYHVSAHRRPGYGAGGRLGALACPHTGQQRELRQRNMVLAGGHEHLSSLLRLGDSEGRSRLHLW